MNKTLLKSPLIGVRTATFTLPALVLGYGIPYEVYRYHRDNKVEIARLVPQLSDIDIEAYSPVVEESPVKRTRKAWRQTAGPKFESVFSVPKNQYPPSYLRYICSPKNYTPVIFRNWCKEAKFEQVDEEIN